MGWLLTSHYTKKGLSSLVKVLCYSHTDCLTQELRRKQLEEDPTTLLDGQIFYTISHGSIAMPYYRDSVPAPERWDIVNYIKVVIGQAAQ